MTFYDIAAVDDVPLDGMKKYNVGEESVLLFRFTDGFFATQTKCPHLFAPLEKGKLVEGQRIQCKFHRAEFDVRSGKACKWANFPPGIQALNLVRGEKDLKTYPTKVEHGRILVDI